MDQDKKYIEKKFYFVKDNNSHMKALEILRRFQTVTGLYPRDCVAIALNAFEKTGLLDRYCGIYDGNILDELINWDGLDKKNQNTKAIEKLPVNQPVIKQGKNEKVAEDRNREAFLQVTAVNSSDKKDFEIIP